MREFFFKYSWSCKAFLSNAYRIQKPIIIIKKFKKCNHIGFKHFFVVKKHQDKNHRVNFLSTTNQYGRVQ